jgi:hypothetical protein
MMIRRHVLALACISCFIVASSTPIFGLATTAKAPKQLDQPTADMLNTQISGVLGPSFVQFTGGNSGNGRIDVTSGSPSVNFFYEGPPPGGTVAPRGPGPLTSVIVSVNQSTNRSAALNDLKKGATQGPKGNYAKVTRVSHLADLAYFEVPTPGQGGTTHLVFVQGKYSVDIAVSADPTFGATEGRQPLSDLDRKLAKAINKVLGG